MSRKIRDETHQIFGRWTVISRGPNKGKQVCWNCVCECGTEKVVAINSLRGGTSKSCGCLKKEVVSKLKLKDLTGQVFARWTVLTRHGTDKYENVTWYCRCACGTEKVVSGNNLKSGESRSCGCLQRENSGENHWNWQGGITQLNHAIRTSSKNKAFRRFIFLRDNYTCQTCGKRGGEIHVDHIKPFSWVIEDNNIRSLDAALACAELWDVTNGRTLCESCHRKTDTYAGKTSARTRK